MMAKTSPRIQKANFDSEIALTKQESSNTANDEWQPVDFKSLKKIAEKFPSDYADKLEVHLLQHEDYIKKLKKENDKLISENNLVKEELFQTKYRVQ